MNQEHSHGSMPPSALDTMHTLQRNVSSLTPRKPVCRSRQADRQLMHAHAFSLSSVHARKRKCRRKLYVASFIRSLTYGDLRISQHLPERL